MKKQVLMYSASKFNAVVSPYKDLTPIEGQDGIFYYPVTDEWKNEYWAIVFEFSGVFVQEGEYRKETILKPDNLAMLQPHKEKYLTLWQSFYVQLIYIRLYECLGLDTSPLWERRKQLELQKEADKKQAEIESEIKAAEAAKKNAERLSSLFDRFKAGELIGVNDFINLIRFKDISIHPRTMGMLNSLHQLSEIGEKSAKLGGKKTIPRKTFDRVFEVAEQLAAA